MLTPMSFPSFPLEWSSKRCYGYSELAVVGNDLPDWAPSESTCRRRLREWTESGLLTEVWARLINLSDEFEEIDWEHLIADGTFCRAKKGAIALDTAARGMAPRSWSSWMAAALP